VSDKARVRAQLLRSRAARPVSERAAAGRAIAGTLRELLAGATRVAAYVGVGSEPPTGDLLTALPEVLLPVLRPDGDLDWAIGHDVGPGARGLLEPTGPRLGVAAIGSCDVVLVPALAVDRQGIRLGRGGGSYDRVLPRATGLTIALVYDEELVDLLPHEPHDVAVAAAATPSYGLVRLRQ
jgi:5-formyltetrahydrofolate cyclo-ligase